jgi:BCD family chlorophyll transporter-like MFS transporter
MMDGMLSWVGIVRLGLVQAAIGSVVVIATSTLNRVMVVELALPAIVPGALVALHYGVQIVRPRLGHGSDGGGRRTPWIVGGMVMLAASGVAAALATVLMADSIAMGLVLAVIAFTGVGIGVGAAGTTLLVVLAKRVVPSRRAAAATIVWTMMIAGIAVTATIAGHMLQPFSPLRLVEVSGAVSLIALAISLIAVAGVEPRAPALDAAAEAAAVPFREALAQVWAEPRARRFTLFVFVSMLAYSAQELILEPFAGAVFALDPGATAKLTGLQHGGVLAGMILVALAGSGLFGARLGSFRTWTMAGCLGSAAALLGLAAAGHVGEGFPLREVVFALGVANGAFAVAAIGAMMGIAAEGRGSREGVRMGLFGAAQAVAFALGGIVGPLSSDIARLALGSPVAAYAAVFLLEVLLFAVAGALAARVLDRAPAAPTRLAPAAALDDGI